MKNCRSCAFFVEGEQYGCCHLHPPEVIVTIAPHIQIHSVDALHVTAGVDAQRPIIKEPDSPDSWCGDYVKKGKP
jgi:hypothetical protein